jgi:hypothetical protein
VSDFDAPESLGQEIFYSEVSINNKAKCWKLTGSF